MGRDPEKDGGSRILAFNVSRVGRCCPKKKKSPSKDKWKKGKKVSRTFYLKKAKTERSGNKNYSLGCGRKSLAIG